MSVNGSKRGTRSNGRKAARAYDRFARRFRLKQVDRVRFLTGGGSLRPALLLAGTALATSLYVFQTAPADAACTPTGINSFNCGPTATTNTTNSNAGTPSSDDRNQAFDGTVTAGPVAATIIGPISGFGLAITNTQAGANGLIAVQNVGNTLLSSPGPTAGGTAALNVTSFGQGIVYEGNGSVQSLGNNGGLALQSAAGTISVGAAGAVSGSFSGAPAISLLSSGAQAARFTTGTITATNGGDGARFDTTIGTGEIFASFTNNVITNNSGVGVGAGIRAAAAGGAVNVVVNGASIGQVGGGNFLTGIQTNTTGAGLNQVTVGGGGMIFAQGATGAGVAAVASGTGAVSIDTSGAAIGSDPTTGGARVGGFGINGATAGGDLVVRGGTIFSTGTGVNAAISGGAGTVLVSADGPIDSLATGIVATSAGTGSVQVTGAGSVTGGENGIFAAHYGLGPGAGQTAVSISGVGAATGRSAVGIDARIASALNAGNIVVAPTGSVAGGTIGINATTAGAGNISIQTAGAVTGNTSVGNLIGNAGINAVASGGNVTVNAGAGAVAGATGINAATTGTGNVTVIATDVVGSQSDGIRVATVDGAGSVQILDNGRVAGGTGGAGAHGAGVIVTATGTGSATITTGAGVAVQGDMPAMAAITAGGNATIVSGANGSYTGTSGLVADQQGGGAFSSSVTVGAGSSVNATGVDPSDPYQGNAILVGNQGTGGTAVSIGSNSVVNGSANGVVAVQTAALNPNGMVLTLDGQVFGNGSSTVAVPAAYAAQFAGAGLSLSGLGVAAANAGAGLLTVTGSGNVSGSGTGIAALATGTGGVLVSGAGATVGTTGVGIDARITGPGNASDVIVTRQGTVVAGSTGINATTAGTGNVVVGTVASPVGTIISGASGIVATAPAGTSSVVTGAGNAILVGAGSNGIEATGATVIVNNQAALGHSAGAGGVGIVGIAGGAVSIANTGAIAGAGGTGPFQTGIFARGTTGAVSVQTSGAGTIGGGASVTATGISASITGGPANANAVVVVADASVNAAGTGIAATSNGGAGVGTTSVVSVSGTANVTAGQDGILATHAGAGPAAATAAVVVSGSGQTTSTGGTGINAQITNAGNAGDVLVNRSGNVTGASFGIFASTVGTGDIVVQGTGPVTGGASGAGIGVVANGGDILIGSGAAIGPVSGGTGISATNTGAGTVTIATTAGSTFAVVGTNGRGISTSVGGAGSAAVNVGAGTLVQGSANFAGVAGNNLSITNAGEIRAGGGTGEGLDSIFFTGGTNNLTFANATSGLTSNTAGTFGNIRLADGATTLNLVQGNGIDTTIEGALVGPGTINKTGGNRITLTGANSGAEAFTGTLNVDGGALRVNGTFGDPLRAAGTAATLTTTVNVNNGGTLDGTGVIAGTVNLNAGSTFAAGNSPGTITVTNMNVLAGSTTDFELGQANIAGGGGNDLVNVTNNLTVTGGTLNLLNAPVSGVYRLYNVNSDNVGGGTFSGAGANLGFTTVTATSGTAALYTSPVPTVPGFDTTQVNARITLGGQSLQFWDGADPAALTPGANGGVGVWSNANTNWTNEPTAATVNDSWQGGVAVFGGTAGLVTVDNTAGPVNVQGLQFTTDGYVVTGGTLTLVGDPFSTPAQTFFNIDGGVATIVNSAITSAAGVGLRKIGAGTLSLGGASTYSGLTTVDQGILAVLPGGSITGTSGVVNNARFVLSSGGTVTTPGAVTNNNGAIFDTAGTLTAATVANIAGGTFNLIGGTTTATTSFTNDGTLNSSGGSIATPTFTNTSVVNGRLALTGNTTTTNQAGAALNGGIDITAAGAATLNNFGTAGSGGFVFGNSGGTLAVNNSGTFNGFFDTAAGTTTTIANNGTWLYQGVSTLAGTETLNNTNRFQVTGGGGALNGLTTFNNNAANPGSANLGSQGVGTVPSPSQGVFSGPGVFLDNRSLTGMTTFNNNGFLGAVSGAGGSNNVIGAATFNNQASGVVSLVNASPTDQLRIDGAFNGAPGSVIALDVNLFQTTRQGDVVRITGQNNGQTTLVLNRLDNPANTFFSSQAVPVVVAEGGGGGQVTLAQPIVGNGFATFELEQTGPGSYQIVSRLNTSAASGAASSISALLTSLNVGFFQSVSAFIGAPTGNNDDQTASTSVSSDPTMTWAQLNRAAAAQKEVAAAPGIRPNTISSGLWARGSGGEFTVRGNATSTFAGGATVGQAVRVKNSFAGMQVGIDTGVFNIDNTGWNLHLGITGGSVFADGRQTIGSVTTGVFDVPFIGVYGALTNGPFFSDLNYRHDFFDARISNQVAGLNRAPLQVSSDSVSGSAGYRFDFEGLFGSDLPYFIEPSGSMSYTKTNVGSLPVTGGVLQFRDIDSILGRFGLRFGTAFQATDNLAVQPFITGSVWHEFAGNTVSRFVSNNINVDPNAFVPIVTDRVGTFGQVGVGISGQLLDTPLLGYVRSDFRFGDKLEGYAVNGGVRYQF